MEKYLEAINELTELYVTSDKMQFAESEVEKEKYAVLDKALDLCVDKNATAANLNELQNAILDYASTAEQHGFAQGFNLALRLCLESGAKIKTE